MNKKTRALVFLPVMILLVAVPLSAQTPGDVISSFSSPSSPFGLTWDGEYLWLGTYSGVLYQIDSSDGSIIKQMNSPGTVASGLGWDWHALWVSDRDADVIRRVDPVNGSVLATLTAPGPYPGGLGWDGWDLWHSNYYDPSHIYYLDHLTGDILNDFPAPQERGMGITFDGISLWNGDYIQDMIHELDPVTGSVINSFAAPEDSPHDLAYDGHYLWVVIGGGSNRVYQIEPGNKNVSIALNPESTIVPAGGYLSLDGSLLNHTNVAQTFTFHVDIYLPSGNPYPGNPLVGPVTLTMQPNAYASGHLRHRIPANAPSVGFLYQAVLTQDGETIDVTNFNFEVE